MAAIPAVALLAGAGIGLLVGSPDHVAICIVLLACSATVGWSWGTGQSRALLAAVVVVFVVGGIALGSDAWQRASHPSLRVVFEELANARRVQAAAQGLRLPEDDEAFAIVDGVLLRDAAPTASGMSIGVEVETIAGRKATGGILVTVVGSLAALRADEWRAGRRVRMPVWLHRPSRYLNPGVPDQERLLARRGTTLVGTIKSGALVDVIARGSWWDERIAGARAFARRAIASAVGRWSQRSAAIVAAIVIGDRAGLDEEVQRRLQEAGTYHVIAISGGNIAILAGLMLGGFRWAGVLGRSAMLAAIGTLIVYAQLVGGGASVDRATLMGVVYFAARAIDQRSPSLNILSVVVAILVAAAPLSVADPAFILTSGATLGILVVGAVVSRWPARPFVRAVATTFAASVAAEAMLFPVGALFFSRITGAGLALNLLAIPLMGVAQIAGMAVVPLALISPNVAAAAGFVANAGATGLLWSADLVRFVPVVTYRVAAPSWWSVIGYYSGLVVWWALARRQVAVTGSSESWSATSIRRAAAAMAVSSALWILAEPWRLTTVRGDGRLHVTVIDVGQGDSIFVRFPRGSTLLVDTGGLPGSSAFDIGDRIVAPVIRAAGVGRLDVVALTHGDPDHLGGAASIVREFRPRAVWEGIPVPRFQPLTEVRAEAEAAGAWWTNVYSGHRVVVEGVEIIAKHPHVAEWERQKVRNDDSLVLELRWREVSIVLTGDIEEATERTLVDAFDAAPLRVVKIPHHGSLTSSTSAFVRALHPEVAIVSAGRSNHFGHPVPDVLERYQDINAEIFRTDRDGAVTVATDGTSLDVDTYTGRHAQWSGAAPHPDGAKAAKSLED